MIVLDNRKAGSSEQTKCQSSHVAKCLNSVRCSARESVALAANMVSMGSAHQQGAQMFDLSLSFLGLHLRARIDPETLVLILILGRLIQRLG